MDMTTFPLGPLDSNCYLLAGDTEAVVIDVGGDPVGVLSALRTRRLPLRTILLTHLHCDHLFGVAALAEATGATVLAGGEDAGLMDMEAGGGGLMGMPMVPPFAWKPLDPGEMTLLGQPCQVLATPGHSPGGRSYYFPQAKAVFVGDLLFFHSIGRTDLPGGSLDALLSSVTGRILTLPPETTVYPGHGPLTTVGDELRQNPYFSEFYQ